MERVNLQPAFILHRRPFRETSLLLELFTLRYGRISAIARGVRSNKSKTRGLLQPFVPLLISWNSKTELANISKIEPHGIGFNLSGKNILSGFYLNELLIKLLPQHDSCSNLYTAYQTILNKLQSGHDSQTALRLFEKELLVEIGYGLQLDKDGSGKVIDPSAFYQYEHGLGFVKANDKQLENTAYNKTSIVFSGKTLQNLYSNDLTDKNTRAEAKKLMRLVFNHLLEGYKLKSRELVELV